MWIVGNLRIPKFLIIKILNYTDSGTIKEVGTFNKYFRKLVSQKYPDINMANIFEHAIKSDNVTIYNRYVKRASLTLTHLNERINLSA